MPRKNIESTGSLFDWAAEPGPTPKVGTTKSAVIYTDGACSPNPGFGGWAAVILADEKKRSVVGGADGTTNNRMELQAAIEGLRALAEPTQVQLITDSQYVRNGITQWLPNWVKRGWQTKDKTPVKNQDLWQELSRLTQRHAIEWRWVKGHAGDPLNEECDQFAQAEADRRKQQCRQSGY